VGNNDGAKVVRKIGYARVSSAEQNLDRQLGALKGAGCDLIFSEKASGKSISGRPKLEKAIDELGNGDVLIVAEWDRATRSMEDGLRIVKRVMDRGAMLKCLDREYIDLTTTIGKGIMAFLSALAQDERERIVKRGKQGLAAARARGVRFGRKPILSAHQRQVALDRIAAGHSRRAIARDMGVDHKTIGRLA
jgi:DNA invertase Pin-like site-specific DNA recombinase